MCGQLETEYPKPVKLCGQDLPWVKHATHLGHELHQVCNMEFDANMKRGEFIENSVQIRETFHFANPEEVLSAIQVYASHLLMELDKYYCKCKSINMVFTIGSHT